MQDAAACLIYDGEVLCAVEEERLTRNKHTGAFPEQAIRWCLREVGATARDLDHVAFNMRPWEGLGARASQIVRGLPGSLRNFTAPVPGGQVSRGHNWLRMMTVRDTFERCIGAGRYQWHFVRHHRAHAASAFYPSPFEDAAVLVLDGSGELASATAYWAQGRRMDRLWDIAFPNSLGYFYSALTEFLGFRPSSHEGKVMGLSSYGEPDPATMAIFRKMIDLQGRIQRSWFDYPDGGARYYSNAWIDAFGPPRTPESELLPRDERLAACGQRRLEEVLFSLLERLHAGARVDRLCLAGGVALNCVANGLIVENTPFKEVWVQPVAHDAGTALGAALHVHCDTLKGRLPAEQTSVAFGPQYAEQAIDAAIRARGLEAQIAGDPAAEAARRLARGEVVGWFQGRAELGPRALGQRSILADPRDPNMPDRVNERVKRREPFRPFAPAVLAERAPEWFTGAPSRFMTTVHRVSRSGAPAITHVDGTARVQSVDEQSNEQFYRLIQRFDELTGVPLVLNTSFNVRGEPIVCRPEEALADYLATDLDALVIGDRVLSKCAKNTRR